MLEATDHEEFKERVKSVLAEGVPQVTVTDPNATHVQNTVLMPGRVIVNDEVTCPVPNGLPFMQSLSNPTTPIEHKVNEMIARLNEMSRA